MLCDHCGDCCELLTDVRVLNTLATLLGQVVRLDLRPVRTPTALSA